MSTEPAFNQAEKKFIEPNEQDLSRAARLMQAVASTGADKPNELIRFFAALEYSWRTNETLLGQEVTDTLTGFSGVATSRVTHLHGCPRVLVEGHVHDGKVCSEWVDEPRLMPTDEYRGTPAATRHR